MLGLQDWKIWRPRGTNRPRAIAGGTLALLALAALALSSCAPAPQRPPVEPVLSPSPQPTATATPAPPRAATLVAPVQSPDGAGDATQAADQPGVALVSIRVLGDELAAGWDTQHSWSTQFERLADGESAEQGPAGASPHLAVFHGADSGLFFAVKPDSPVRYLRSNYVAARVWVNPGDEAFPADGLKFALVTGDRHPYWDMGERPVPPDRLSAAGEVPLPALNRAARASLLPANTWTEILIWFNQLPTPPAGRYLTGLYFRAENNAGRRLLLSRLDLLAVPDNTRPVPQTASVIGLDSLRVTFNKDVDAVTAEDPANYRITSAGDPAYRSARAPAAVTYEPDTTSAVLSLAQALQPGVEYSVEVREIADLAPLPRTLAQPATLAFTATFTQVTVDLTRSLHAISPYIYGIAGTDLEYMRALRPGLSNWGGNPTSRYNWELGNAFNAGSDWEYRNTDYGYPTGSVTDRFIEEAAAVGAAVRITLPTLGWVAKDTDSESCSFTGPDGKCYNPGATCQQPGAKADPNKASIPVDVDWVMRWVRHMIDSKGYDVRFFAMDNEPDLWGFTHYDVHPDCSTYQEILDTYLMYATAVRAAVPDAELLGPVSCCWYFYWNSPAGDTDKAKHDNQDFLPWFLDQVRQHDEKAGVRTLDALDIHYYPENVYNDQADPTTSAARVHATRALWDDGYVDPSWIAQPVQLIPRMRQIIAANYPGTKLFISEWNFGGDKSMSGALAIADALGIFGEQDLYAASYYQRPELGSPGFFGFKMYTNYDDQGGGFGDIALPTSSADREQVAAYAGRDSETGKVTVMLINKLPDRALPITLQLDGLTAGVVERYRYGQDNPEEIARDTAELTASSTIDLPPYSITLLVLPQQGN